MTCPNGRDATGDATRDQTRDATRDGGSAGIWVLACSTLLLVIAVTVALRTTVVLARHRAGSAADAAALAAAGQIGVSDRWCEEASYLATADNARVQACRVDLSADGRAGSVEITVSVAVHLPLLGTASVRARARAERDPTLARNGLDRARSP